MDGQATSANRDQATGELPAPAHHEKFKMFNTTGGNYAEVENFLNKEKVRPRSLSIAKLEVNFSVVTIGYDVSNTFHRHQLVTKSVIATGNNLEAVAAQIEAFAADLKGIICQDVVYSEGVYIVTFLTAK